MAVQFLQIIPSSLRALAPVSPICLAEPYRCSSFVDVVTGIRPGIAAPLTGAGGPCIMDYRSVPRDSARHTARRVGDMTSDDYRF
ncbi:hypothetical protein BDV24DRAFT_144301 [Aspergillus arachidicola]|uniref:Uncharacterized protein n=1 Tax=Aspergillus arachidicola TaxID=656916 RepID=A0A5N6XPT8_9EURO|nr:hypothetical protein BDV24DRAFT_144301 [Aspergillus arachidicola]